MSRFRNGAAAHADSTWRDATICRMDDAQHAALKLFPVVEALLRVIERSAADPRNSDAGFARGQADQLREHLERWRSLVDEAHVFAWGTGYGATNEWESSIAVSLNHGDHLNLFRAATDS